MRDRKIAFLLSLTLNVLLLPALSLAQNINSFQGNVGISCIDGVCFSNTGKGFYYGNNNGNNCNVIDNKIYKNGQYLRDMTPDDFAKMAVYRGKVDDWRVNLQQNILKSIPWSETNPEHYNFPWNPFGNGSPYVAARAAAAAGAAAGIQTANAAVAAAHNAAAAAAAGARAKRHNRQQRDYLPFPQVPNLCD